MVNKSNLDFNPFVEYGITDPQQFKKFPFLQSKGILRLQNKISSQIRDKFTFPERLLILGEPGIGKTTALFFIESLLINSKKCNVFLMSKFFKDGSDFKQITGEDIFEVIKEKTYILVDFPDTINQSNFKKFLDFLWTLIHHKYYSNLNFIFSLNISHYNRSLNLSEIFHKFDKFRLDRWDREESETLIKLRLKMAGSHNIFNDDVYDLIFKYSKGIPRNIICASKTLVDEYFNKAKINYIQASSLLKEEYFEKIINDRVENIEKRLLYKNIIKIIEEDFHKEVKKQNELLDVVSKKIGIGRNKCMKIISDLYKFGVVNLTRGGVNNVNKIITLK